MIVSIVRTLIHTCVQFETSIPKVLRWVNRNLTPDLSSDMFVTLSDLQYDETYLGDVSFSVVRSDGGTEAQRSAIGAYVGPYLVESPAGEYRITGGTMVEVSPGEWVWTP